MSKEQLNAFLEKVQGDTSLQEKLNAPTTPEAVIEIAKDAGFQLPQKIFNQCNRNREKYQMTSLKVQLADWWRSLSLRLLRLQLRLRL